MSVVVMADDDPRVVRLYDQAKPDGPDHNFYLRDVAAAPRPGGRLVVESRNPAARPWHDWAATGRTTRETTLGTVTEWMDVEPMTRDGHVSFLAHNVLAWSGETIVERQTLAFRSEHRIRFDLADAGLQVEAVGGGWNDEPVGAHSRVMVFQAQRPNLEASDGPDDIA